MSGPPHDSISRRLLVTGVLAAGLLAAIGWWYTHSGTATSTLTVQPVAGQHLVDQPDPAPAPTPTVPALGVDVIGAVLRPGLYFLPPGARIQDALAAAGGLLPNANRDAINLSARIVDGQQLRVPRVGDAAPQPAVAGTAVGRGKTGTGIDLNTADVGTLTTLPGIGPVLAQRIIDYRTTNGPFGAITDLQHVKGITPGLWAKIKDRVHVGGQ